MGDNPLNENAQLWSGLADRVQRIRELVEEERVTQELDDQTGVRARRKQEERFLGMWVTSQAVAISEALWQFAWLIDDLEREYRYRSTAADEEEGRPDIAKYHRCVRAGVVIALGLATERAEKAGIVRPREKVA